MEFFFKLLKLGLARISMLGALPGLFFSFWVKIFAVGFHAFTTIFPEGEKNPNSASASQRWVATLLLCGMVFSAAGQAPRFEAKVSDYTVTAGATLELTFTLSNAQPSNFGAPDLRAWRVEGGPNRTQGSQAVYANGKVIQKVWVSYGFVLRAPDRPGKYTIGAAQIQANGNPLSTQPLTIEVVQGRSQNTAPKQEQDIRLGNQILLRAEPLAQNTFAGEQLLVDFRLYYSLPLEQFDVLAMPEILNANVVEIENFDRSASERVWNGKRYTTQVLRRLAVYPLAEGPLEIGPLRIRVQVPVQSNDPWTVIFAHSMPYELESEPAKLNIMPPPPPPASLNGGGVGDYLVYAAVDKTALSTDDALLITLTIEGKGDLRTIKAPTLRISADSFEVFEPAVQDGPMSTEGGTPAGWKRFDWTILPKMPANPANIRLDFTWLDTRSRGYRNLDTSFVVQITQGNRRPGEAGTLDYARQDIRPYRTGARLEPFQALFFASPLYKLLWALPFASVLFALFWRLFYKKNKPQKGTATEGKLVEQRLPAALEEAQACKASGDAPGFYRAIYAWARQLPETEASQALRKDCELVLFAGLPAGDLEEIWQRAIRLSAA